MKAALQALRLSRVSRVILAVPVAPRAALGELSELCDRLVCLMAPDPFYAVGAHYAEFDQTDDDEVVALLREARQWG